MAHIMNNFQNIPDNELFDPSENMLAVSVDKRIYHRVFLSAEYAVNLVENGTHQSLARAEDVVRAVLECQELDKNNPHHGNFFWEKEEGIVEDLNAVEFVLIRFIPMTLRYSDRISKSLQKKILSAIRIALDEVERVDVGLIYTNIVAQDIVNSILGGQLLEETAYIERGVKKLKDWRKIQFSIFQYHFLNNI